MLIKKRYFVILNTDMEGVFSPLMLSPDTVFIKMFETEEEAFSAGDREALGRMYGYEVFEIGDGVDYSTGEER